jgi:Xaa-Pro aminopeptidase
MSKRGVAGGERMAALQESLVRASVDVAILSSYESVTYFSGVSVATSLLIPSRVALLVVPARGSATLVICALEIASVDSPGASAMEVVQYEEFAENPFERAGRIAASMAGTDGRIGLEYERLTVAQEAGVRLGTGLRESVPIDLALGTIIQAKDRAATDDLVSVAALTQSAIHEAAGSVWAGDREQEFLGSLFAAIGRAGAVPVFAFFGSGSRAIQTHPDALTSPLRHGEVWRVDAGLRSAGGFHSDLARCGSVGAPSAPQIARFNAIKRAQVAAVAAIRPGVQGADIYSAAQASLRSSGFDLTIPHVGHGIGVMPHEEPRLSPDSTSVLVEGAVLCVEPAFFDRERGEAYHVEDLVRVTASGAEFLTRPQERLIEIGRR